MTEPLSDLELLDEKSREIIEYFSRHPATLLNNDETVVGKAVDGVRYLSQALIASQKRVTELEGLLIPTGVDYP